MKEKAICILMVLVLALGLCGCGERGSVSQSNNGKITDNPAAADDFSVRYDGAGNYTDENYTTNGTGYSRTGFGRMAKGANNPGTNNNGNSRFGIVRGDYGSSVNPNKPLENVNDDYSLTGHGTADSINRDMVKRDAGRIDQRAYDITRHTNGTTYHGVYNTGAPRL